MKYISLLKANRNLIFTGAPGTGKTHLAKELVKELTGMEADSNNPCYGFVQFHPSYDYTDFIEGLRPTKNKQEKEIGFERQDGIFKAFCKKALKSLNESPQPPKEPTQEKSIEESFTAFLDYIAEELKDHKEIELIGLIGNSCAPLVGYDGTFFNLKSEGGSEYPIGVNGRYRAGFLEKYKNFLQAGAQKRWTTQEFKETINENKTHPTYYYAILKLFDEFRGRNYNTGLVSQIVPEERKDFVFVIDEINRGDISKIFGELFFSIDPGYRGKKGLIKTQYQNLIEESDSFYKGFYIPENVYVIGTMNDIDRSVESMDFAMRRRFAWMEIEVTSEMLDKEDAWTTLFDGAKQPEEYTMIRIKNRMNNLNNAIIDNYDTADKLSIGLSKAYQIGASYFLKYALYAQEEEPFQRLWENHLRGVLFEYLRGVPEADIKLKALKDAYNDEYGK